MKSKSTGYAMEIAIEQLTTQVEQETEMLSHSKNSVSKAGNLFLKIGDAPWIEQDVVALAELLGNSHYAPVIWSEFDPRITQLNKDHFLREKNLSLEQKGEILGDITQGNSLKKLMLENPQFKKILDDSESRRLFSSNFYIIFKQKSIEEAQEKIANFVEIFKEKCPEAMKIFHANINDAILKKFQMEQSLDQIDRDAFGHDFITKLLVQPVDENVNNVIITDENGKKTFRYFDNDISLMASNDLMLISGKGHLVAFQSFFLALPQINEQMTQSDIDLVLRLDSEALIDSLRESTRTVNKTLKEEKDVSLLTQVATSTDLSPRQYAALRERINNLKAYVKDNASHTITYFELFKAVFPLAGELYEILVKLENNDIPKVVNCLEQQKATYIIQRALEANVISSIQYNVLMKKINSAIIYADDTTYYTKKEEWTTAFSKHLTINPTAIKLLLFGKTEEEVKKILDNVIEYWSTNNSGIDNFFIQQCQQSYFSSQILIPIEKSFNYNLVAEKTLFYIDKLVNYPRLKHDDNDHKKAGELASELVVSGYSEEEILKKLEYKVQPDVVQELSNRDKTIKEKNVLLASYHVCQSEKNTNIFANITKALGYIEKIENAKEKAFYYARILKVLNNNSEKNADLESILSEKIAKIQFEQFTPREQIQLYIELIKASHGEFINPCAAAIEGPLMTQTHDKASAARYYAELSTLGYPQGKEKALALVANLENPLDKLKVYAVLIIEGRNQDLIHAALYSDQPNKSAAALLWLDLAAAGHQEFLPLAKEYISKLDKNDTANCVLFSRLAALDPSVDLNNIAVQTTQNVTKNLMTGSYFTELTELLKATTAYSSVKGLSNLDGFKENIKQCSTDQLKAIGFHLPIELINQYRTEMKLSDSQYSLLVLGFLKNKKSLNPTTLDNILMTLKKLEENIRHNSSSENMNEYNQIIEALIEISAIHPKAKEAVISLARDISSETKADKPNPLNTVLMSQLANSGNLKVQEHCLKYAMSASCPNEVSYQMLLTLSKVRYLEFNVHKGLQQLINKEISKDPSSTFYQKYYENQVVTIYKKLYNEFGANPDLDILSHMIKGLDMRSENFQNQVDEKIKRIHSQRKQWKKDNANCLTLVDSLGRNKDLALDYYLGHIGNTIYFDVNNYSFHKFERQVLFAKDKTVDIVNNVANQAIDDPIERYQQACIKSKTLPADWAKVITRMKERSWPFDTPFKFENQNKDELLAETANRSLLSIVKKIILKEIFKPQDVDSIDPLEQAKVIKEKKKIIKELFDSLGMRSAVPGTLLGLDKVSSEDVALFATNIIQTIDASVKAAEVSNKEANLVTVHAKEAKKEKAASEQKEVLLLSIEEDKPIDLKTIKDIKDKYFSGKDKFILVKQGNEVYTYGRVAEGNKMTWKLTNQKDNPDFNSIVFPAINLPPVNVPENIDADELILKYHAQPKQQAKAKSKEEKVATSDKQSITSILSSAIQNKTDDILDPDIAKWKECYQQAKTISGTVAKKEKKYIVRALDPRDNLIDAFRFPDPVGSCLVSRNLMRTSEVTNMVMNPLSMNFIVEDENPVNGSSHLALGYVCLSLGVEITEDGTEIPVVLADQVYLAGDHSKDLELDKRIMDAILVNFSQNIGAVKHFVASDVRYQRDYGGHYKKATGADLVLLTALPDFSDRTKSLLHGHMDFGESSNTPFKAGERITAAPVNAGFFASGRGGETKADSVPAATPGSPKLSSDG